MRSPTIGHMSGRGLQLPGRKHWAREHTYVPVVELIRATIGRYELAAVAGGWFASSEREGVLPDSYETRCCIRRGASWSRDLRALPPDNRFHPR
jgi:hypothetical protein